MSTVSVRDRVKRRPAVTVVLLTVVGYGAVLGAFLVPEFQALFPDLSRSTIDIMTHAIAAVNSLTILTLSLGWYWIRNGEVRKHAAAMVTSFALILLFLGIYVPRVAGGGTKYFDGPELVGTVYLVMLGIHILLSILAVPVVLYAICWDSLTRSANCGPRPPTPRSVGSRPVRGCSRSCSALSRT